MKKKSTEIRIGTSGWMYKDWGKMFYPPDMKSGFLEFLSREFNTVEVNSSFYHLPRTTTFAKWGEETPEDFVFAVKLSRFITHTKLLTESREPLERFLRAAAPLGPKLGVVLVQLPPRLPFDEALVRAFLADLSAACKTTHVHPRFALEPRHISWMDQSVALHPLLRAHKVALVFPHSARIPSFAPEPENVLADFIYVRFHGPSEFAASRYGASRLRPWVKRMRDWQAQGLDVFCYFNNDIHGHAVEDARTLKHLLAL